MVDTDFPGVSRTDVIYHLTKGSNKCNSMYILKTIIMVTKGKTKPNQNTQYHESVLWLPHSVGRGDQTLNDGSSTDTEHSQFRGVLSVVVFYEQILAGGSCRVPCTRLGADGLVPFIQFVFCWRSESIDKCKPYNNNQVIMTFRRW